VASNSNATRFRVAYFYRVHKAHIGMLWVFKNVVVPDSSISTKTLATILIKDVPPTLRGHWLGAAFRPSYLLCSRRLTLGLSIFGMEKSKSSVNG
jgi:hypothetical protein